MGGVNDWEPNMTLVEQLNTVPIPLAKLLGIEIIEAEKDSVIGCMVVREDLCTAGRILHGGAMMALADTLSAIGAFLNLPQETGTATLESKTNFLGSVKAGRTVKAEAVPLHLGRRTSVWQTRISDEDGRLVGIVTQTQMTMG